MKLDSYYYQNTNVVFLAKDLIGKILCTYINDTFTSGIITETEAYNGVKDKACHAYNNRRTKRTETMFQNGGISYVYLCYGIHYLFNIVTSSENDPKAILIRNIAPLEGIDTILNRRKKKSINKTLLTGPGTLTQALGINKKHNNIDLTQNTIWIEDRNVNFDNAKIKTTPRIGINYAEEDALLPYRFVIEKNVFSF